MSSYLSLFGVISFSWKSTCPLVVFHGCSSHVKASDLASVFLTLAIQSLSQTQQDTACRRHEKFRVVVSAVSDPCARWDTHSKPSRREAPTQKGFYTAKLYTQQAFTQRILYTQKLLHTANFYTQKLLHTEAFTHSQLLHRETLTQS